MKPNPLILITILLSYLSSSCYANTSFFKNIPCESKVFKVISSLGTPKKWEKVNPNIVKSKFIEGGNLALTITQKTVTIKSAGKGREFSSIITTPGCKLKLTSLLPIKGGFTDQDLSKLLLKNKSGLIYLWSPHMSLSVFELSEMQKYEKSLNKPIKVLMDLHADKKFAKNFLNEFKLPHSYLERMNSRRLESKGITIHYPSIVIYKNGKILKRIPGYNSKADLKKIIRKYL